MTPMETGEFSVVHGERFVVRLSFHPEKKTEPPMVITGYTFTGALRTSLGAEETITEVVTDLVPFEEGAPANTAVDCSISEDILEALDPGVYSIKVLCDPPADGAPFCALEATLRVGL